MMIHGDKKYQKELISIWKICFGDEDSYIQFFLEHWLQKEHTLLWMEDSHPVAMVFFLPAKLAEKKDKRTFYYVYALATLPAYRGRGIAKKLLEFGKKEKQTPLFLTPAQPSLFSYYEKLGFSASFWIKTADYSIESLSFETFSSSIQIKKELSAQQYLTYRRKYFQDNIYIDWEETMMTYLILENQFFGGKCCEIQIDGFRCGIFWRKHNRHIILFETALCHDRISETVWKQLLYLLAKKEEAQTITVRFPYNWDYSGIKKPIAMSDNPTFFQGYANLLLDL